ncbi:MAG: peptidase, partial [Rhizobiaceae bacterium]|nr:peptidase [Rhizobiaceae bacterium]
MKLKMNFGAALALAVASTAMTTLPALAAAPEPAAIIKHYADVAHAKYQDALTTAQTLDKAIDALLANP